MAKNAVYYTFPKHLLSSDILIKQAALMFDRIYIYESETGVTDENKILFEYLENNDVITPFTIKKTEFSILGPLLMKEFTGLDDEAFDKFMNLKIPISSRKIKHENIIGHKTTPVDLDTFADRITRANTAYLRKQAVQEFYPVLRDKKTYQNEGKKEQVVEFVLEKMPQPVIDTPWEAIVDFRKDESIRLKYLALINWINEIASSRLSANEISEKYEYLYLDYKKSFDLHKLKSKLGVVEVLAGVGVGLLTSDLLSAVNLVSNFVRIGLSKVNLHKEEGHLPGKEIAYLYHVNKAFM